jgi:energy-coupling factor transporter ATP-binding protein EcfA2
LVRHDPESKRSDSSHENLLEMLKEKFRDAEQRKFVFLLVGRTGVGKSSTVNSLMGVPVAPVGDYEPQTFAVEAYEAQAYGIRFRVVDTPGLCDDLEESGNDGEYLRRIVKNVTQLDCMLFVTKLPETRVTSDEKRAIKLITDALGTDVWRHSVIVFTFAGFSEPERYERDLANRAELVRREVARYVSSSVANRIPAVAIDNHRQHTPDGREWLGALYSAVFTRMHEDGLAAFFLSTAERVNIEGKKKVRERREREPRTGEVSQALPPPINLSEAQSRDIKKRIDGSIFGGMTLTGAAIGSAFGPAGAAIGGAIGAGIALIAWLWD